MDVWWNNHLSFIYIKIWNHPIETSIYKWSALGFQVVIPYYTFGDSWGLKQLGISGFRPV